MHNLPTISNHRHYLAMIVPSSTIFLLAALPTLTHLASSSPLVLLPTTNISAPAPNLQCIDSPDWATLTFVPEDCYLALENFHTREVEFYESMMLEFLAANIAPSFPSLFAQTTPRKYEYKTCTMAIVMLRDLPGEPLPVTRFPKSDLSTYLSIGIAAKNVLQVCLSPVRGKGGRMGGGLGFVNPTGYDVTGTWMVQCIVFEQLLQLNMEKLDMEKFDSTGSNSSQGPTRLSVCSCGIQILSSIDRSKSRSCQRRRRPGRGVRPR